MLVLPFHAGLRCCQGKNARSAWATSSGRPLYWYSPMRSAMTQPWENDLLGLGKDLFKGANRIPQVRRTLASTEQEQLSLDRLELLQFPTDFNHQLKLTVQGRRQHPHRDIANPGLSYPQLLIAAPVSASSSQRGTILSTGGPICVAFMPVMSAAAILPRAIS